MRRVALIGAGMAAIACTGCAAGITGQPSDVAGTTARVTGAVVTTTGQQVEFWAEYGKTTAYGSSSEHYTTTLSTDEPQPVERDLTGLTRATTYHYRFCARDSDQPGGPRCGEDATVTTVNVDCGDVITHDVVLSASLSCRDWYRTGGLVVGADGVDIDLNGHTISGTTVSLHAEGEPAIENDGHDDVGIHDGTLSGWGYGVVLRDAGFNRLRDLDVKAWAGIEIDGGDGNTVRRYHLTGIGRAGHALSAVSDHLLVADSSGPVWYVGGEYVRIVRGQAGGIFDHQACLWLTGNHNRVVDSSIGGCPIGGLVVASGTGHELIRNQVAGSSDAPDISDDEPDGIRVEPFTAGTLIRDNVVHDNEDDGIDVRAHDARLKGNSANDNGDFGIDAVAGVTDLGANTATGNGNTLQCRNILCQ
jgi:Right handed beta helix region